MSTFTPGEWFQGTDPRQIESSDGTIICRVSGSVSHPGTIPDARLISAAPDMYEALTDMLKADKDSIGYAIACDNARKALAKADGK